MSRVWMRIWDAQLFEGCIFGVKAFAVNDEHYFDGWIDEIQDYFIDLGPL